MNDQLNYFFGEQNEVYTGEPTEYPQANDLVIFRLPYFTASFYQTPTGRYEALSVPLDDYFRLQTDDLIEYIRMRLSHRTKIVNLTEIRSKGIKYYVPIPQHIEVWALVFSYKVGFDTLLGNLTYRTDTPKTYPSSDEVKNLGIMRLRTLARELGIKQKLNEITKSKSWLAIEIFNELRRRELQKEGEIWAAKDRAEWEQKNQITTAEY